MFSALAGNTSGLSQPAPVLKALVEFCGELGPDNGPADSLENSQKPPFPFTQCRVTGTGNKSPSLPAAHRGYCVGTGPCAARVEPWVLGPRMLMERAVRAHRAAGAQRPGKAPVPHIQGDMSTSTPDTLKPIDTYAEGPTSCV